jgi:hypothetical protein
MEEALSGRTLVVQKREKRLFLWMKWQAEQKILKYSP